MRAKKVAGKTKEKAGSDGLTTKERLFVEFYLGEANLCGAEAARMAGFKDGTGIYQQAYRMLGNVEILKVIENRLNDAAMGTNEVLSRLTKHARGSLIDVLDDEGQFNLKVSKERGTQDLLKELEVTQKIYFDEDGEATTETKYKYKIHDAQSALEKLGRYHKLFTDKSEVDVTSNGETILILPKVE